MRIIPLLLCICAFLILYFNSIECKRGGGSRSKSRSSSSSSSFWNRKKTSESKPAPAPAPKPAAPAPAPKPAPAPASAPKPSAPVQEDVVRRQQSSVQQSSPNQRPIGWDANQPVNNQNAFKTAQGPPPYSANVPPGHTSYGQAPPAYGSSGQAPHAYGAHGQAPPPYGAPAQAPPPYGAPYNPHQSHMGPPPQYSPYPQQQPMGGMGYNNMGGMGYNNMGGNGYNNMGGNGYNNMGGMGYNNMGYNNPQKSGGILGGIFGGNKHNGGGFGGYGYNPYAVKKSSGFFGKHAFRNILGGVLVWYAVKGLFRRPYNVYNYYNQPETTEKIELPANMLTLCEENSENMCLPGSTAICTRNNTILCVTTMAAAVPCPETNQTLCLNSTVPCLDKDDPLCQNKTADTNTANVNLPCFANVTVDVNLMDYAATNGSKLVTGQDHSYCVTAMAVAGPEEPNCPDVPTSNTTVNPACVNTNPGVITPTPGVIDPTILNGTKLDTPIIPYNTAGIVDQTINQSALPQPNQETVPVTPVAA